MKDRFTKYAGSYAQFRPLYPAELYNFLFSQVKELRVAWDAGTGNGQAARELARKFERVYATDISAKQLENAAHADNILYSQSDETINLPGHSVDLVTVAQAIHWFDRNKFYLEVKRVGKPGGVLAVWGYSLLKISPEIDPFVGRFYKDIVGPYWDPERRLIDEHYRTIEFPFLEIKVPEFAFAFQWTLDELGGYLSTWSAVQKYIQANQKDPVPELIEEIQPHWNSEKQGIAFPLFMRMGRI